MNDVTMVAGRELDTLVAEKVIGEVEAHAPCGDGLTRTDSFCAPTMADADWMIREAYQRHVERGMPLWPAEYIGPEYSTDIAAAWEVVEQMRSRGSHLDLMLHQGYPRPWSVRFPSGPDYPSSHDAVTAETAPHAICLAALKAVGA